MRKNLKTIVCIIGSGFCGYAAYTKLKDEISDLLVIEGGNIETPQNAEEQKNYRTIKNKYLSNKINNKIQNGLEPSFGHRKYTLGGSSECWAGYIKPFEESTYKNEFVNIKGQNWDNINLRNYYDEVSNLLKSPITDFEPENIESKLKFKLPELTNGLKYTTYAWALDTLRLKYFWKKYLIKNKNYNSKNKKLICGYRLHDFNILDEKIRSLSFKNQINDELIVEADYFIFSMGGIENAKFVNNLFKKTNVSSFKNEKLGNFQEHPHLRVIANFNRGENPLPKIITERIRVSKKMHNSFKDGRLKIAISAWDGLGTPKATFMIRPNYKNFLKSFRDNLFKYGSNKNPYQYDYTVDIACEQTPNIKSNLNFNSNTTYLNWNIQESDFEYYSKYLRRFTSFLILNKFAKDFSLTEESIQNKATISFVGGGGHHMGTVPYTTDKSLIDEKFKLSLFQNTYVVGTSSFPTSGFENPTHAAMTTALLAAEDIISRYYK